MFHIISHKVTSCMKGADGSLDGKFVASMKAPISCAVVLYTLIIAQPLAVIPFVLLFCSSYAMPMKSRMQRVYPWISFISFHFEWNDYFIT